MELPHYLDRLYESTRQRQRYATEPAYRLKRVNRYRIKRGLPLASSPDEIGKRGQKVEA